MSEAGCAYIGDSFDSTPADGQPYLVVLVDLVLDEQQSPGLLQLLDGLGVCGPQVPDRALGPPAPLLLLHLLQEAQVTALTGFTGLRQIEARQVF